MIVADTNLLAYLLLPTPMTALAESVWVRDSVWVAPALIQAELRNVMLGAVRRGDVARDDALALLEQAQFTVDTRYEVDGSAVLKLALDSGCSAYDCEFVWLALWLKVPLVTGDRQVLTAFPDAALGPDRFVAR